MKKRNNHEQIHVHIDADAFFASVEQVIHRELKGKAIVIGQNGGIVSALSYPAKALGISRVSPIRTVRKNYPDVKIVASDFYYYGVFSKRMERIIKNHFPHLIKNSIDEASLDLTEHVHDFEDAKKIITDLQQELQIKLGCTFSFGIARTPLLAKLASGLQKPNGITVLNDENVQNNIYHLPASALSGIGKKSYEKLKKYQIKTIGDFIKTDSEWLADEFNVMMPILQQQAQGFVVSIPKQKEAIKSMSRDRSFEPTNDYEFLYSQMSMNIEHLCQRMRKENVTTKRLGLGLRKEDLSYEERFITLTSQTREPEHILLELKKILDSFYQDTKKFRKVSVTCASLESEIIQYDLFGSVQEDEKTDLVLQISDSLEKKFGKSCINFASSMHAEKKLCEVSNIRVDNDTYPHPLLPGEQVKKRLPYPYLGLIS